MVMENEVEELYDHCMCVLCVSEERIASILECRYDNDECKMYEAMRRVVTYRVVHNCVCLRCMYYALQWKVANLYAAQHNIEH